MEQRRVLHAHAAPVVPECKGSLALADIRWVRKNCERESARMLNVFPPMQRSFNFQENRPPSTFTIRFKVE